MENSQQFSLRWNNYLSHITNAFDSLRSDQDLVDVTLSCEGKRIRAHKMLLSACSTYFRDLFKENPCQHPVIIFRNVRFEDLAALIDFMYQGEVNVLQDQLTSFLTTAELLAVQGLASKTTTNEEEMENDDLIEAHSRDQNENKSSIDTTNILLNKNNENYLSQSKLEKRYQKNEFCPPLKKKKWSSSSERNKISSSSHTTYVDENSQSIRKEDKEINNQEKLTNHSSTSLVESHSIDAREIKKETPEYASTPHSNDDMYDNTTFGEESDQNIHINDSECSNIDSKQEIPSSDELSSFSVADIGQILGKPSTSNEEGTIQDPSKIYFCDTCGNQYAHRTTLQSHRKKHLGETNCSFCGKMLSRKYTYHRHMWKMHGVPIPRERRIQY